MYEEFPTIFKGDRGYEREWLENLIQWVAETYECKKETIIATLVSILPKIEEDELEQFLV